MASMKTLTALLFTLFAATAHAQPVLLVASSSVTGAYARTVLFAMPARNGAHVGFVLNRPTNVKIPELKSPVFAGGPEYADTLFAFVHVPSAPAERAVQVLPNLYLAFQESDVEQVLERFASRTRVFAGLVSWEAESLEEQVEGGAWHVLDPDVELVLEGSVDTLWSRLIDRAESMTASRAESMRARRPYQSQLRM
jgi:putative AlgH/UPF0301 family transcriptional regulator